MYRIAIVDDEDIVRRGLINLVPWDSMDCHVVCEAADGQELVDRMSCHPEIVITDIKMPRMDGIQLCAWLHENHPEIQIIMLTAYADFEYARQSIKYGVTDYVTKSGGMQEVASAVQRAIVKLDEAKLSRSRQDMQEKSIRVLQDNFFKNVFDGFWADGELIQQKATRLQISLTSYAVVCMEFGTEKGGFVGEYLKSPEQLFDFITRSFPGNSCWTVPVGRTLFASVVSSDSGRLDPENLKRHCSEMISLLDSMLKTSVFAGICPVHSGSAFLPQAFQRAKDALSKRFLEGGSSVYCYESDSGDSPASREEINQAEENVLDSIDAGDPKETAQLLEALFALLQRSDSSEDSLKGEALMLNSRCCRILFESKIHMENLYQHDVEFYQAITACRSLDEYRRALCPVILSACEQFQKAYSATGSNVAEQAQNFIRQNFQNNITLNDVASQIHVNPSYLSRVYKQETGNTVMADINGLKIEHAKEILRRPGSTVLMAAMAVGIDDAANFSHFFKKHVGISPKQFQQNLS